jgi:hypothetical protein
MTNFVKELKQGATTASEKISKTVSDIMTKNGGSATGPALDQLKKAVIGGIPTFDPASLGIPGLDAVGGLVSTLAQSQKDLPLASGYDQGQTKAAPPPDFKPPLPNQLSQYASVNCIFTLSILSDEAINFPDLTYRKGQLGPIILKSANGAPAEKLIQTAYGAYNFYMDNFKMTTIMGLNETTGVTNATTVSFSVIEPYSMGLFFQALQIGAYQAGHANYTQVPLLLTLEWKGWTDLNKEVPLVIRQIPIKLRELGMQVTGKGCTYTVDGYPWNEQALSKTYNEVKTDIGIECDKGGPYTIQNLLQRGQNSLQAVLNRRLQEAKKGGRVDVPDEMLIVFPTDLTSDPSSTSLTGNELNERGATSSPSSAGASAFYNKLGVTAGANSTKVQGVDNGTVNLIGQALLGFNEKIKGESPFAKDADSYDKEKGIVKIGSIEIDLNNSKFHFTQGALISDIIVQVILNSDYGRNALNQAQLTPDGQIVWFRVETQVYNIPQEDGKTGTKPKCIVFRVVPYKVDSSRFMPVNSKKPGLDKLKIQALKQYDYIYTGKNTEILNFNIDFQAGFYTAMFADKGQNSEGERIKENTGQAAEEDNRIRTPGSANSGGVGIFLPTVRGTSAGLPQNPTQIRYDKTESKTAKQGGASAFDDPATVVARQFQDVITNQADMINLELEILGDPYYITDSGMGNYSAKEVQGYDNITGDGSVNYQNGEVVVAVNFRTPIDIDLQKGMYSFGDTRPVAQFSGLFRVISVDNTINTNKFTQVLQLVRLPGQEEKLEEKSAVSIANNESSGYTAQSQAQRSPAAQSVNNSSSSYYGSTTNQTNNINTSPPNPGLPGIVNTGGRFA